MMSWKENSFPIRVDVLSEGDKKDVSHGSFSHTDYSSCMFY